MDASTSKTPGSDLVLAMLEIALAKARHGQVRSALLITLKHNGIADLSGEFTDIRDIDTAIKKLAEARRMLKGMQERATGSHPRG